jgi:hypothetical protein
MLERLTHAEVHSRSSSNCEQITEILNLKTQLARGECLKGQRSHTSHTYLAFAGVHEEALAFDGIGGRVADVNELTRAGLVVLAKGGNAVAAGFDIAGKQMICGIEGIRMDFAEPSAGRPHLSRS